jgi:hypothetical protein
MKSITTMLWIMLVLLPACSAESTYVPVNGDIIFHTSTSSQSVAIQLATNSPYSHMGIVYVRNGKAFVFEAIEPVKMTPLGEWIARGEKGHFVVKRLANASEVLNPDVLERMHSAGEELAGRHYDLYFEWSDERIYCSELVWKIYMRGAGVQIGDLQSLADFDLSSAAVQKKMKERWADGPPGDEKVISPAAMFESSLLVEVFRGKMR